MGRIMPFQKFRLREENPASSRQNCRELSVIDGQRGRIRVGLARRRQIGKREIPQ